MRNWAKGQPQRIYVRSFFFTFSVMLAPVGVLVVHHVANMLQDGAKMSQDGSTSTKDAPQ